VKIDGGGSAWNNSSYLRIGDSGNGTVNVTNGGNITCSGCNVGYSSGSTGTATIANTGSTWNNSLTIYVGNAGSGAVNIIDGGNVTSAGGYIGYKSGSTGVVTVDGVGSVWTSSGNLSVGGNPDNSASPFYSGGGILSITNGGTVSNRQGSIGSSMLSTGAATVSGAGSRWVNSSDLNISGGTLNVANCGAVSNNVGYIGYAWGSLGTATIDGTGSTWTSSSDLYVSYNGSGTLNVRGGKVIVGGTSYVGYYGYNAAINFGIGGGILTTGSLAASPNQVTGTGTIITHGLVSDVDLVLDTNASLNQTLRFSQPGQDITLNLDMSSNPSGNGDLGAGWRGKGSLTIQNGIVVNSTSGRIGHASGSTGVVTVDGTGTTWTNSSSMNVGHSGTGTLNITGGGSVNDTSGYIGDLTGSTGVVRVDQTGSMWSNSSSLYVGNAGSGTLTITRGGTVAATSVSINSKSLLAIDVGNGSLLTVGNGSGTITNNGKVRVIAGARATAGTIYTPISASTWNGNAYQAIGGMWNSDHTFTVSTVKSGQAGTAVTLDTQRVLINDTGTGKTGWSVGASFLAGTGTTSLTATAMSSDILSSLGTKLAPGESLLSAFDFSTTGAAISSSNPAYLSFDIGPGSSASILDIWHYDATSGWTAYSANDLTYDGTYASFTVTGFSGYAVTEAVPEPSTLVLLGIGAVGLLAYGWKRRRTA
jgi:fibronectin-binding autotransporter adhesin